MGVVIGLIGGIASGKSAVAAMLARRGLLLLDADAEARAVVRQPQVLAALADRFGQQILAENGELDRASLAQAAFASKEATEALNALTHPEIRQRLLGAMEAVGDHPVVLDVALLIGSPMADMVTTWVFVRAGEATRDDRAKARKWSSDERARREALQATLAAKQARADHILENDGSIEDLERQVDALLERIGVTHSSP
jgi:dephospho-CoA kinase